MEVIVILILASLALAGTFLAVFFWATRDGQFEDTTTPAMRMLTDDPPATTADLVSANQGQVIEPSSTMLPTHNLP